MNKSLLYAIESFTTLIIATILGDIFSETPFIFNITLIYLLYLILSLIFFLSKNSLNIVIYAVGITLFVLIWQVLDLPLVQWIFVFIYIYWRITSIQSKQELTLNNFYNSYFALFFISLIYFIFSAFKDMSLTINIMMLSYLITFIILILGSLSIQFNKKRNLKTFIMQFGIIFGFIGLFLAIFFLLNKSISKLIVLIKSGVEAFILKIGSFLAGIIISSEPHFPFISNNSNEDESEQNDIYDELSEKNLIEDDIFSFIDYVPYVILILIIVIIVIAIAKRFNTQKVFDSKSKINDLVEESSKVSTAFQRNNRKSLFVSSNPYRKLYQQFLIWLIRKKIISSDDSYTTSYVLNKLNVRFPTISQEITLICEIYEKVRYGNLESNISVKKYKELIKSTKAKINSSL